MQEYPKEYITYRIERSLQSFRDAQILAENQSWNSCINRLYYACFYIVTALLLKNKINVKSHSGMKSQFALHFIKTGKLKKEHGELLADLMDWRQKGDYGDMYDFERKNVEPIIQPVADFIKSIEELLKDA
jgi:uncharacterized protein (UPF0332 family)